jgi:RNA polymerase sigma factor (sigma-70 family)
MHIPLIERHYLLNRQKLVKRMYFRSGSEAAAEDIVQTAYERAIRYCLRGGVVEKFDQWFTTVLNNAMREYQNNEKGYSHRDEDEEETSDAPCSHYPARVMAEILSMIEERSEDHQEILTLYFHQEYTATDISQITEHSYAKVHQTIQRFRNELKVIYKE